MKMDFIETFETSEKLFERIAELKRRDGKLSYAYYYNYFSQVFVLEYCFEFTQEEHNDEP